MDIRSIVVSLEVDGFDLNTLKAAASLAQKRGAHLTGIAAAEPSVGGVGFDLAGASATVYASEREQIEKRLQSLEEEFRQMLPPGLAADWRAYLEPPTMSLVSAARTADVIIIGAEAGASGGYRRSVDVGELVLTAGRPVMAVGSGASEIWAEKVVIGWKDTREARRAVVDAMPFLTKAREVVAVTVREGEPDVEQASLDDLMTWLDRHEIKARGETISPTTSAAAALQEAVANHAADLLVTGGYGHSRTREWLFGGMTRDLIATPAVTRFMSN